MHYHSGGGKSLLLFFTGDNRRRILIMIDKRELENFVNTHLDGTDMFLVETEITPTRLVRIEIDSDSAVDIDKCVELSRQIEESFDPEIGEYELEVGSSGITSPFKTPRQYRKNIGREVETLTKDGKKLKGILRAADDTGFTISVETKVKPEGAKRPVIENVDHTFGYEDVKQTKYLLKF